MLCHNKPEEEATKEDLKTNDIGDMSPFNEDRAEMFHLNSDKAIPPQHACVNIKHVQVHEPSNRPGDTIDKANEGMSFKI